MSLGSPSYPSEGDLMQATGGAFRPANLIFIGSYTFQKLQTIDLGTGASGITETGPALIIRGADATNTQIYWETFGNSGGPFIFGYNTGGTRAAKTATPNGAGFLTISARGYDGTAITGTKGYYSIYTGSLWSGTSNEIIHEWLGCSNGSTTGTVWLQLLTLGQIKQLSGAAPAANTFPGNILFGVNNAAADTAGQVGETITSTVSGVAVAATGTVGNITSISLTAGKWNICAFGVVSGGATGLTSGSTIKMSIVTTTATNGTSGSTMTQQSVLALLANDLFQLSIPAITPVNITATTTYYLTEEVSFAAGSPTAAATIVATRLR